MNTTEISQKLILQESNSSIRLLGILFFPIAIILIPFYFYATFIFGQIESLTLIIIGLITFIGGLALLLPAFLMVTLKDRKIVFDNQNQSFFVTEKDFFSTKQTEFNYHDIQNFIRKITELENNTFYDNLIVLKNLTIEIPSQTKTDENLQNQQLQQIKDFLSIKPTKL